MSIKKLDLEPNKTQIVLLLTLLSLGICLRFINLETKIFWVDEIATLVRVSGYTISEISNNLSQENILEFENFLAYQGISSDKTFVDSWQALTKSPEHAPLYFVLTRVWMQFWGDSISVVRSLSACFSLLVFPSLYWLCQELFNSPSVSRVAVMLMSVSPFYVAYAQEARPYSLWTVTILIMSASFLRAIRINKRQSWLLYSFCLIIGLYTSLFSIYVGLFQGIYLLFIASKNKIKVIKNYLLASLLSYLVFSPWLLIIIKHLDLLQENTSWMRGNFNISEIIAVFIGTVLLIFGDLPISKNSDPVQIVIVLIIIVFAFLSVLIMSRHWNKRVAYFTLLLTISSGIFILFNYTAFDLVTIVGALVALIILSLSSYSLYYLIVNTNCDRWLFILCLMVSLPLPLLIADIINQGQSSTAPRYLIPLQLGIQIAVAYTFANNLTKKIALKRLKARSKKLQVLSTENKLSKISNFWRSLLIVFLILGIFSCIRNLNLSPFYQKGRNINNPAIAKIINQSDAPLVIVETKDAMDALSLAYSLSSRTKYKVIDSNQDVTKYIDDFQEIFILKSSIELKERLQQNPKINLQQVYKSHLFSADEIPLDLWKIERANS